MSYLLDKTNNFSTKITVEDGTIDNVSTSLTLIGRSFVGWGEAVNENFLALLENFASDTGPRQAVAGQLWYDTASARLKYFNGIVYNTIAAFPPLTEGFLYNNDSNVMSWIPNYTMAARILPTNSTGGLNAYLQRTSTGDLTWVTGTSLLTDALPSGNGFVTKNVDGTYSLTATNTVGGYTLPTASTSVLGGVKVDGTTVTISSGIISAVSSGGTSLPGNATGYLYNNGSGALSWGTPSGGGGGGSSSVDIQTFNSTGTWTKPSGYAMARIQLWGGGAGGAKMAGALGGSGGGYNETTVPLSYLASTVTITVGGQGLGRTGTAGVGSDGGTSSVPFSTALTNGTTTIYAYGGGYTPGGTGGNSQSYGGGPLGFNNPAVSYSGIGAGFSTPFWNGGAGGVTPNGCCGTSGAPGSSVVYGGGGGGGQSFAGGASVYGGAGGGVGGANGINGNAPGGGGMGSSGITEGGNGAAGRVVITCWGGGNTTTGSGGTTLPAQSGNGGKFLTTDGSSLSWGTPSGGGGGGLAAFQVQYYIVAGSYTWTVPAGVTLLRVAIGSGVYSNGINLIHSVASGFVTVIPGASIAITVGGAGATTSFGSYLTAAGSGTSSIRGAVSGSALVTTYAIGMVNYIGKSFDGTLGNETAGFSSIPAVQAAFTSGSPSTLNGYVIIEY